MQYEPVQTKSKLKIANNDYVVNLVGDYKGIVHFESLNCQENRVES